MKSFAIMGFARYITEKYIPIFQLNKASIKKIEKQFPTIHPDSSRSAHITYSLAPGDAPTGSKFEIVGTMDKDFVQAFVVKVDGQFKRPDGLIYHITWSFDRSAGARSRQSAELLKKHGWVTVRKVPIVAFPKQMEL